MAFCRKCGKEIPDDSLFCNSCGTKVLNENSTTNTYDYGAEKYNNSDYSNTYNRSLAEEKYDYLSSYPTIFNSMLEVEKRMLDHDYKVAQQMMRSTAEFIHKYLYEQAGGVKRLDHKGMIEVLYEYGIYDVDGYDNFDFLRDKGNSASHGYNVSPEVTKKSYEILKTETRNFVNDYVKRDAKIRNYTTRPYHYSKFLIKVITSILALILLYLFISYSEQKRTETHNEAKQRQQQLQEEYEREKEEAFEESEQRRQEMQQESEQRRQESEQRRQEMQQEADEWKRQHGFQ